MEGQTPIHFCEMEAKAQERERVCLLEISAFDVKLLREAIVISALLIIISAC